MTSALRTGDVVRIDEHVHAVRGGDTNWVIVKEGDSAVLIDTGYPGDRERLLASLAAVGVAPGALAAVLVTHAHNDHLGSAERLRAAHGTPVLMHEDEVPHARRDFLHQVSVGQVLARAWRPGVAPWALRALRAGGTAHLPVADPRAFPADGPLDLPGAPVPVHSPGTPAGTAPICCRAAVSSSAGTPSSPGTPPRARGGRSCCRACSTPTGPARGIPWRPWKRSMRTSSSRGTARCTTAARGTRRPWPVSGRTVARADPAGRAALVTGPPSGPVGEGAGSASRGTPT